jgi:predicted alpha/beta superfamily hydrolase
MRKVLYLFFFILFEHVIYAQNDSHLYHVGTVDSLYSKVLNETRTIYVQTPESYIQNKTNKYPVVYVIDGEVFLPTVCNVHDFYSGGFIPEMVIVGVSNDHNRTEDLTPSKITTKYGMPFNASSGGASKFLKFFKEELIPYLEGKYPVTNYRSLIGHSYGGLFAIYTLLNDPQLFANYISIDPSLDWDNQILVKQAEKQISSSDFTGKSLYVSLSGQLHMQDAKVTIDNVMQDTTDFTEFARSNIGLSNLIKNNNQSNLLFEWQFYPNDIHGTVSQPSIKDGLLSLFKWFPMENTDRINNPATSKDELQQIVAYRANKLENHLGYRVPPYPEELLNMSGYMNLEMQELDKSKMYFELAIKYYPNSANVYDSMADYYESQNDTKNALKFATKSFEINASEELKKRIERLQGKK